MTRRKIFWLFFAVATVVLIPSYLVYLYRWPTAFDFIIRAQMLSEVSRQVMSGELYPLWLTDVNAGLGSPLMLFQPMFINYIGVLFYPLAGVDPHGFFRLLLSIHLYAFACGVACFYWLRLYFDDRRAACGAMFYIAWLGGFYAIHGYNTIFMPYIVAPLCLIAAHKMLSAPLRYVPHYAVTQAAMMFSSLPYTLTFSYVPLLYVVFLSPAGGRVKAMGCALFATALGGLLAGLYWLPAVLNRSYILYDVFLRFPFRYQDNFLPVSVIVLVALPVIVPLVVLMSRRLPVDRASPFRLFAVIVVGLLFMVSGASEILWDTLPLLHNLQFPHRFMFTVSVVGMYIIALGYGVSPRAFWAAAALTALVVTYQAVEHVRYKTASPLPPYYAKALAQKAVPHDQHMTIWMREAGITDSMNLPAWITQIPDIEPIKGNALVRRFVQGSRSIAFDVHVKSDFALFRVKRLYYPGWKIARQTTATGVKLRPRRALMVVGVPRGRHHVVLEVPWFPGERLGLWLSMLGLGGIVLVTFADQANRERIGQHLSAVRALAIRYGMGRRRA